MSPWDTLVESSFLAHTVLGKHEKEGFGSQMVMYAFQYEFYAYNIAALVVWETRVRILA
jgi:hypothetical protein